MTLFERVLGYIKSAGHAVESEEHKLLNEFVSYLGSEKVVSGFSDSSVVKDFAATIVPIATTPEATPVAEEPVEPTPVESVEPVEETAPVIAESAEEVPAESTISVSE